MQLKQILSNWLENSELDTEIHGIQNDSRLIKPGDLFLAYPGADCDGRNFIKQAVVRGAAAIVFEAQNSTVSESMFKNIPIIPIADLANAMGQIAKNFYAPRGQKSVITAVTGTNGKTTIAYQLAQAHTLLGQSCAYIGTIGQGSINSLQEVNNTTPDSLSLYKSLNQFESQRCERVCMEVSSHALMQNRVANIDFNQAIFTNLSQDHLDFHNTMDNYAAAKARLFENKSLNYAIVNVDDPYHQKMIRAYNNKGRIMTYGIRNSADVQALEWQMGIHGTEVQVKSPWGMIELKFNAPGQFNIYNNLAIFSSLICDGYDKDSIIKAISKLRSAPGRLEVVAQSPYVIVDYAHTPDALENVLKTLKQLKHSKLWVVFGCGGDRDKSKRPLMGKIASQNADRIIITSDNPRSEDPLQIIKDINAGICNRQADIEPDRKQAILNVLQQARAEDIILIAGKGHETYQQIGDVKAFFSDQIIVKEFYQS